MTIIDRGSSAGSAAVPDCSLAVSKIAVRVPIVIQRMPKIVAHRAGAIFAKATAVGQWAISRSNTKGGSSLGWFDHKHYWYGLTDLNKIVDPATDKVKSGLIVEKCSCGAIRTIEFAPGEQPVVRNAKQES